ncbi:hypothetical protein UUU_03150 (plasmid) [Klebsiella pneumoniae subsp. pneumoniae DSM 30104 = JCM 1662 = NBRC 14940]|nr:hypothetical protein UUU_03150 [Klebsiella pneumoniae subsp. pneumoniae DSM 30104 = JCM 1662 = NBRC 14940]
MRKFKIKPHTLRNFADFTQHACFVHFPTELSPSPVIAIVLRDYSAQRVTGAMPIPVRDRH